MLNKGATHNDTHQLYSIFASFPFFVNLAPQVFRWFMMFLDICMIMGSFVVVVLLRHHIWGLYPLEMYFVHLPLLLIVWIWLLYSFKIYQSVRTRRVYEIIVIVLTVTLLEIIIMGAYLFTIGMHNFVLLFTSTFSIAILIIIEKLSLKYLLNYLYKRKIHFRNILIVGTGSRAQNFIDLIYKKAEWRINIVGLIDEDKMVGTEIMNTRVIGSFNDLARILDENIVDEVVFILPRNWLSSLEDYVRVCEKVGVKVSIAVDFFSSSISKLKTTEIYGQPFMSMDTTPYNIWHLFIKRIMDISVSFIVLLLNIPVFIICSIVIKLTSHGPVIFRQKRIGLNGRSFTLFKFRSMVVGAENMLGEIRNLSETKGPVFHSRNDPRVTPAGRFLRMSSLDELPQLFNVLIGDMSLIGPRPPLPEEVEEYERWQRRRLSLRPGIVCTWQVTKRFQPDFQEWMKMDLDYIDNWSLGLDFKIFIKVFPAILKGLRYWRSKKA